MCIYLNLMILIKIIRGFISAAHRYDEIQLNYRDGGEIDAEGGIQFSSGSAIKKSSMKPITPDEFRVMKSYLNVM
ncbi:hypothetical protein F1652_24960 [Pluralibacter gergoviae]|nr:hypothetical protein [Pluralibacter gergoviae]